METHLVLCCCPKCKDYEITELLKPWGEKALLTSNGIVVENSRRYVFIVDINNNLERLRGLHINSYRVCDDYYLEDKTRDYLKQIYDKGEKKW